MCKIGKRLEYMQNEMIDLINSIGLDKAAELVAEYLNQKILSEDVAMQFILEELEAASKGNDTAQLFAKTSGFDKDDYEDSMNNSFEQVDGKNGPQQELLNLCMMLYPNQDLMVELRIRVVDHIMKIWELGKYAAINNEIRLIDLVVKRYDLEEGVFANINNDLNDAISENTDILLKMAYGYARRVAAAGLYLQGIFNRDNYDHAVNIFKSLQLSTGQSREFQEKAYEQAIEFLQNYDNRFNKIFNSHIISSIELNQAINAYESDLYFTDEQIFDYFTTK